MPQITKMFDSKGNECESKDAVEIIIQTTDNNGVLIEEKRFTKQRSKK